ncbi:MAG: helix-turn-helix domain-containing protein [Proteobacteria bacterium]|nr:helix-turn-helix domain-containing protein [Pseudomonadota bacterium]
MTWHEPVLSSAATHASWLAPVRISSEDMEPSQLLQYWQDHLCRHVIQAHCSTPSDHPLFFDLLHYPVPGAGVTWLRDSPQLVTRAPEHVKRAEGHHVVVMVQHEGTTFVRSGDCDIVLNPGDVGLVADWRPSLTTANASVAQSVLMVPLEQMRGLLPKTTDLSVLRLDGGHHGTGLVQQIMQGLHLQLKWGTDLGSVGHFQQALLQSVAGACLAQGLMQPQRGSRLEHYYFERMEAFIRAHLGSAELLPASIAAHVGLSVSHAQRLYRTFGTSMTRSIRDKRLDAAQRDLRNPSLKNLTVQEIAYQWGFYDAAHLSHAFRKAFGVSPKEWRVRGQG